MMAKFSTIILSSVLLFTTMQLENTSSRERSELITIASYNSRGLSDNRKSIIKELLSANDIVFIQEHWLFNEQLHHIGELSNCHMCHAKSGMEMEVIHQGRPYGGCAIFWKKNLCKKVELLDSKSNRITAVKFYYEDTSLLLLNVYMPCDKGVETVDFTNMLELMGSLIHECNADYVIIGGDCNTDFQRKSIQTDILNLFLDESSLYNCRDNCKYSIDYTYINRATGATSCIDHYFLTYNLSDCVEYLKVNHRGDNLSDHDPIQMKLRIPIARLQFKKRQVNTSVNWSKATNTQIDNYRGVQENLLKDIVIPFDAIQCSDLKCQCKNHINAINKYCKDIVDICLEASNVTIPVRNSSKTSKIIPGWNEHCESLRQASLFWHHMWIQCGRPHNGHIAEVMRRVRAKYHYSLRWVKSNEDRIRNEKLASDLVNGRTSDYWKEIKSIKGVSRCIPLSMDNEHDDSRIAEIFAKKYGKLYNCIEIDKDELDKLLNVVDEKIDDSNINQLSCCVSVYDIELAIGSLNKGKSDGASELASDHIINCCKQLHIHISMLLSSMLRHGTSPNMLKLACMVPIPKNKKGNLCDSDNYRAIALISCISKMFDLVILKTYGAKLATSDMQFGFKDGCSTNTCTFVMKETISYYINNGNYVFSAFLDASKAFDRVNYCKLFKLLLKRDIPPCVIRLVMSMYTDQSMFVKWNGSLSKKFSVSNGVKQGGVLSPILFCLYIDELLCELRCSGFGCNVGNTYCGCLGYADDITLLSPSVFGLQKLINICENYAKKYDIQFNECKSKVMIFSKTKQTMEPLLLLNNNRLHYVDSFVHLGHVIKHDLDDADDVRLQRGKFVGKANAVLSDFKGVGGMLKYNVIKTYCYSFYGSQLWNLQNRAIESLCVSWRRACKKTIGVPQRTHTKYLPLLCRSVPFISILYKRFIKFYQSCLSNTNNIVRSVAQNCLYEGNSGISHNLKYIRYLYNIPIEELNCKGYMYLSKKIDVSCYEILNDFEKANVKVIEECISVRDGLSIGVLTKYECIKLIDYLCTI